MSAGAITMTLKQALAKARELEGASSSWQLDAEILLAAVLDETREYLHTWPDRQLNPDQLGEFRQLLSRRGAGEPVAYILGRKAFWDFELEVTPAVLIPRPETELLVELALQKLSGRETETLCVADLGTGSGAIAIAIARVSDNWQLIASDISDQALEVASRNARNLGVANIAFRRAAWCDGMVPQSCDLVVSNPPYVVAGDAHLAQDGLDYEPSLALVAGNDGLSEIRQIILQSREVLKENSWLIVEHGFDQHPEVVALLKQAGFKETAGMKDLAGNDRVSLGCWPGKSR